ncbi:hypothetical protein KFK09_017863 [Dendrobium nobile]|uniref:Uncharacterized protein n=1 Tax=Dendrobium nobile TaxID=94219 RepID=A0A8T3AZM2_DENNO|nr:hypothetical protein KFK09_017863 [Dendrobium nobile]
MGEMLLSQVLKRHSIGGIIAAKPTQLTQRCNSPLTLSLLLKLKTFDGAFLEMYHWYSLQLVPGPDSPPNNFSDFRPPLALKLLDITRSTPTGSAFPACPAVTGHIARQRRSNCDFVLQLHRHSRVPPSRVASREFRLLRNCNPTLNRSKPPAKFLYPAPVPARNQVHTIPLDAGLGEDSSDGTPFWDSVLKKDDLPVTIESSLKSISKDLLGLEADLLSASYAVDGHSPSPRIWVLSKEVDPTVLTTLACQTRRIFP